MRTLARLAAVAALVAVGALATATAASAGDPSQWGLAKRGAKVTLVG
ncbi:hypothetical protein Cs7R123_62620 [Catellatospora sp. TT07R-123]|nr:hypothetical protein [Catellatospora sp. TT07R-123]GHJ48920.1 hypothetical protein Cs7R123_62620 [Catellatospora sp. TT07R-123]